MNENIEIGIGFLLLGIVFIYFSLKKIKKFRKEKYDPFKDKSEGIFRLMNAEVYYKSYGVLFFGIVSIVLSIIFLLFLND